MARPFGLAEFQRAQARRRGSSDEGPPGFASSRPHCLMPRACVARGGADAHCRRCNGRWLFTAARMKALNADPEFKARTAARMKALNAKRLTRLGLFPSEAWEWREIRAKGFSGPEAAGIIIRSRMRSPIPPVRPAPEKRAACPTPPAIDAEKERLRDRLESLEADLGLRFDAPAELELTAKESTLFGRLLKGGVITRHQLMTAAYADGPDDEPAIKIVDVFICRLRKKIGRFGLEIRTVWGVGFEITPDNRARFERLWPQRCAA